jgi:hypothetical protein
MLNDIKNLKTVYGKWLPYSKSISETIGTMFLGHDKLYELIKKQTETEKRNIQFEAMGSGIIIDYIMYDATDTIIDIKKKLINKNKKYYKLTSGNPRLLDFYLGHSIIKLSDSNIIEKYITDDKYVITIVFRTEELEFLTKIKQRWDKYTNAGTVSPAQLIRDIIISCRRGYMVCLKYLESKVDIGSDVIEKANITDYVCLSKNMDLIKYLIKKRNTKCTFLAAQYASQKGNIDMLNYLIKNEICQLTKKCCTLAISNLHYDCFELLIKNNCPFDKAECIYAADMDKREFVTKLLS